MIGKTLQLLRTEKGYSLREASKGIISASQLSKIENDNQVPAADKFFYLLYRMNVNYDDFCMFTDDKYINIRTQLNSQVGETLRKKNLQQMQKLMALLDLYYDEYQDDYFTHMKCVLKASYTLLTTDNDYEKAGKEVQPVVDYLNSIGNWYSYEFSLLNNILFFFNTERALSLGDEALKSIEKRYSQLKDDEITRRLLNNLAILALKNENHYMFSYRYSSTAIGLPQSTKHIYSSIYAKIINQISCYKLDNSEYNQEHLSNLVNWFKLINMQDIYQEIKIFVESHGIVISEI